MKKTLAAVAVLGAFAGSALAADVTLYGRVDTGLKYMHTDLDVAGQDATNDWAMTSGNSTGSRFGIKGSEQIADGLTVGFQLENGFDSDSGKFGDKERMFNRESRLYVTTEFGEIAMGRYGRLASDAGAYSMRGNFIGGSSWGSMTIGSEVVFAKTDSRLDNMVTYKSPKFGGVTVLAQYGMGNSDENTSKTDRYAGIGALGNWGDLTAGLIVESTNYKSFYNNAAHDVDDSLSVEAGVAYDFGVAKVGATAQYFKDAIGVKEITGEGANASLGNKVDGYGVKLAVAAPALGGQVQGAVGYMAAEATENSSDEFSRYTVGATYKYPLSKRTYLYTAASYTKDDIDTTAKAAKPSYTEVMAGMVHYF